MKRYVLIGKTISPTLSLKALIYETDFTDQEVDTIATLMVGDTFKLDDNNDHYLAVKRVGTTS